MKSKILCLLALSLFILFSQNCKKSDIDPSNSTSDQISVLKDSAKTWLDLQQRVHPDFKFIDTLKEKLLWDNLSVEKDIDHERTILYVPVKLNNNYTGIVFNFYKNTFIMDGYFIEIPSTYSKTTPTEFLENLYSHKKNKLTASISATDISHSFLWELGFTDGEYKYKKNITNKPPIVSNSNKVEDCIDWYWITYYSDGSSDERYLGRSCDDCATQNTRKILTGSTLSVSCGGGGGSGASKTSTGYVTANGPSSAKAVIAKIQGTNYGFTADVTNKGLFATANLFISYNFDFNTKVIDKNSVQSSVGDGMLPGDWRQTNVTSVYSSGDYMYFTLSGYTTSSIPGVPGTVYSAYTIYVSHNIKTNMVYFDNQEKSFSGGAAGGGGYNGN